MTTPAQREVLYDLSVRWDRAFQEALPVEYAVTVDAIPIIETALALKEPGMLAEWIRQQMKERGDRFW